MPESESCGFHSWVYTSERPFDANRFYKLVATGTTASKTNGQDTCMQIFAGVLRSKGRFFLAQEQRTSWSWSSSFSTRTVRRLDQAPNAKSIGNEEDRNEGFARTTTEITNANHAKRCNTELVFIGIRMNVILMQQSLDNSLASDAEIFAINRLPQPVSHPWSHVPVESTSKPISSSS